MKKTKTELDITESVAKVQTEENNPIDSHRKENDVNLRFRTFAKIAYDSRLTQIKAKTGLPLATLIRWQKDNDIKVSKLRLLEKAGLNIGWAVTGLGTMFAHNEIGEKLRNDKDVSARLSAHIDKIQDEIGEKSDDGFNFMESLSVIKTLKDDKQKKEHFFIESKKWFHSLNKGLDYLLTNFIFETIIELMGSDKKEKRFNINPPIIPDIKISLKDILISENGLLPLVLAFLDDYMGKNVVEILDSANPEYIISYFNNNELMEINVEQNEDKNKTTEK